MIDGNFKNHLRSLDWSLCAFSADSIATRNSLALQWTDNNDSSSSSSSSRFFSVA